MVDETTKQEIEAKKRTNNAWEFLKLHTNQLLDHVAFSSYENRSGTETGNPIVYRAETILQLVETGMIIKENVNDNLIVHLIRSSYPFIHSRQIRWQTAAN